MADNDRAYNNRGALLMNSGQQAEGAADFKQSVRVNPGFFLGWYNLALYHQERGQHEEALALYRRALELRPDAPAAIGNLARMLLMTDRAEQAEPLARQALLIRPDDERLHLLMGDVLQRMGGPGEAARAYEKALELNPRWERARLYLGASLVETGRRDEGEAILRQAADLATPFAAAHKLLQLGRARAAALFLAPYTEPAARPSVDTLYIASWILATAPDDGVRDGNRAVELAERAARELHAPNPMILDALAAACAEAGRFDEAVKHIESALALVGPQEPPGSIRDMLAARAEVYRRGEPYRDVRAPGRVQPDELILHHEMARQGTTSPVNENRTPRAD